MRCPYCRNTETKVVDKRDNNDEGITRRRRECLSCAKRFTTYERIEKIDLKIGKKDGTVEQFNREKLKKGLIKAVDKRNIGEHEIERILDDIEIHLLNRKSTIVHSVDIGKMVLSRLRKIDSVAYMRFASVYKDFRSVEDFKKELSLLKE